MRKRGWGFIRERKRDKRQLENEAECFNRVTFKMGFYFLFFIFFNLTHFSSLLFVYVCGGIE